MALATGFVIRAYLVPEAGFGFVLTAVILGATGVVLAWFGMRARRSAAEADRITSTGLDGTATITGLTQTGMSLYDQPQVEMDLLVAIPGLAQSGLPAVAPFASQDQANYTVDQLRAAVRANGIDGTATIDKLADTGEVVGDERLLTMQVTLHVPGQPDRQLQPSAAMVPLTAADKVAVGRTVPVKVAPDNPNLVLFEWEKLAPDGPPTMI